MQQGGGCAQIYKATDYYHLTLQFLLKTDLHYSENKHDSKLTLMLLRVQQQVCHIVISVSVVLTACVHYLKVANKQLI